MRRAPSRLSGPGGAARVRRGLARHVPPPPPPPPPLGRNEAAAPLLASAPVPPRRQLWRAFSRARDRASFEDLPLAPRPFEAPDWAASLSPVPRTKVSLGQFPTPVHRWNPPGVPCGDDRTRLWIKRDDWSGMELGGNKVRKLEFLLADALGKGHDTVVTIGGIQSNHVRATAAGARLLGLGADVILRASAGQETKDPRLVGNLLPLRMTGASINLVTKNEYGRHGSTALLTRLAEDLRKEGKNPYCIPVGGSNGLGTWGYLAFVEELVEQMEARGRIFDHVVLATGSGGTATGIALGLHLAFLGKGTEKPSVSSFAVCDSPDYFYRMAEEIAAEMGMRLGVDAPVPKDILEVYQAKGNGYAISSGAELQMIADVARTTGVLLDPVYSGKAYYQLSKEIERNPEKWKGDILFLHTGGMLGMYEKVDQLLSEVIGGQSESATRAQGGDGAVENGNIHTYPYRHLFEKDDK